MSEYSKKHKFSESLFVLGTIIFFFDLIYFVYVFLVGNAVYNVSGTLGVSFMILLVSLIMIGIGNKKVP